MANALSLTGFVWNNLHRRRLRTLLTLGGISMAVGAFVGLVGFSRSFEQQWMQIYSSSGIDIAVIRGTFLNTSLDESATDKLKALPFIAQASPVIFDEMDLTPDVNALIFGWQAGAFQLDALQILSGARFHDGQPEVMLGDILAQDLKKQPGDTLEIQGTQFKVTGVYHSPSSLEADAVIMPLDQLQLLSSVEGKVSTIDVRLKPAPRGESWDRYVKAAQAQIESALPGLRAIPALQRASDNQFVKLAHASAWGTSSLALLIGILGIANTMVMSVFERTQEIGTLRALGWKKRQILALIELESAALGLGGGVAGIALGWLSLHILASLPQTATFVSDSIRWPLILEAMVIALLSGLIAGIVPAWRAGKLSPVDALYHE
ncbi:MAG: FtsX-like permease family protein [Terracidiphilus sp.]|jgi:putative ABC transport system permease protein